MGVRVALVGALAVALVPALPGSAFSSDRWENGTYANDDNYQSFNVLRHGLRQTNHDLEGSPDQDWYLVRVKPNHSYEVRASSGTTLWETLAGNEAQLDHVTQAGSILTHGTPGDDDTAGVGQYGTGLTVRWIASADTTEFIRVIGNLWATGVDNYDIEMFDTTYPVARWNNSATQITVFLIRNNSYTTVAGNVVFFDAAGALLHTQPFTIPSNGLLNVNTATIGALAGQAGSALVANTAGYGMLSGKAVALEPGTGFTFDLPIEPFPR